MAVPDYPENRREQYLSKIATGDGDIPAYPENREEQYLDAIARNGGGGGGGGGGVLLVPCTSEGGVVTLGKTWSEIRSALLSTGAVMVANDNENYAEAIVGTGYNSEDGVYYVSGATGGGGETDSPDGYPTQTWI